MTGVRDFAPDRWLEEGDTVRSATSPSRSCTAPAIHRGAWCSSTGIAVSPMSATCCSRLRRPHRPARRQPRHPDQLDQGQAAAARRRHRLHLRPRRRLELRPGAHDQSVPDRRDVTVETARRLVGRSDATRIAFVPRTKKRAAFPESPAAITSGFSGAPLRTARLRRMTAAQASRIRHCVFKPAAARTRLSAARTPRSFWRCCCDLRDRPAFAPAGAPWRLRASGPPAIRARPAA